MMGHKMCFYGEIRLIIPKLSLLSLLIWSTLQRHAQIMKQQVIKNISLCGNGMDAWMTGDFTSLSTVFQSYQDEERLIMKGCVQWNLFTVEKNLP